MRARLLRFAFVFAAALAANVAWADDDEDAKFPLYKLLDEATAPAERQAVFDHIKHDALAGKAGAQFIVGTLYRIGKLLPVNLVDTNIDEAKKYLSSAAGHGYVNAMATMAEIELAAHHSMEAMLWAQLYGHYKLERLDEKARPASQGDAYFADLLHRAEDAFDKKDKDQMQQYFGGFIAAHDADIRAGIDEQFTRYSDGKTHSKVSNLHYDGEMLRMGRQKMDVLAEYVVGFGPDGTATRAWQLDALPDYIAGKELRRVAMRMKVNASDDPDTRYAIVPLAYTFGQFRTVPGEKSR
jgi:hypothetical protein